jgi:hypothetical protein
VIRLPERTVTRFFIPLIDVLLLLFCIYLLMPLAESTGAKAEPNHPLAVIDQARKAKMDLDRLRKESDDASRKLAALRQEKTSLLHQRLAIKVLEIDPKDGKLFTYGDGGARVVLASPQDAERLIRLQREEAGGRELYYLFLFPREDSKFPQRQQREQYERWFASVPHGRDNPRGGGH